MATQSVASVLSGPDRDFFNIETVSGIRKAESEIVARLLGDVTFPLGSSMPRCVTTLRIGRSTGSGGTNRQSACVWAACRLGEGEVGAVDFHAGEGNGRVQPDEIWMPLDARQCTRTIS